MDSLVTVVEFDLNFPHAVATALWQVVDDRLAVVTRLLVPLQAAICVAAFTPPEPGSPSVGNWV